ncbi:MAG: hypothetical protein COX57_02835 [Alphaproteobacteria bacterium CG_4_10_14_0_2_um_filter_63_37]|nr:MAG: hypothetical protein AUJ55_03305 [Proteobacteria bacterium CG1_02_64_396]PJA25480.1 MAG: hypothetical protein COX57_02835 [Alphaproteobacteria bacterium CG_4_10_14_0_2_um_filter_63_37]
MADPFTGDRPLLAWYGDLYAEVARIKQAQAAGQLPLFLSRETGGRGAPDGQAQTPQEGQEGEQPLTLVQNGNDLAAMVSDRLIRLLRRQQQQVEAQSSAERIAAYRGAVYVMAAQVDELFILDLEWKGALHWPHYLIERAMFNSDESGENLFARLDTLLADRSHNPLNEELAAVFLMALHLGFQGKYRGSRGKTGLADYRRRLLRFIGADATARGSLPPFEQAYRYTLSESTGQRLAPLRPWLFGAVVAASLYVAISTAVWFVAINPFNTLGQVSAPTTTGRAG